MQIFRSLLTLSLAASAIAAPIVPRASTTAAVILSDFQTVVANVKLSIASLNGFTGGLLAPAQISAVTAASQAVHLSLVNTQTDSSLIITPFSAADSQSILDYLDSTLKILDPQAAQLTVAKKPLFDQYGLSSTTLSNLKQLLADHNNLDAALFKWFTPQSNIARAYQIAQVTTDALNNAIAAYS